MPAQHNKLTMEIRRLYEEEKLSLSQIAERFGIMQVGVRQCLIDAGVTIRGTQNKPKVYDAEKIKRLYLVKGMTREEIAKRLKCSPQTISEILKANGVTRRYQGAWRRKYTRLADLQVGESVTLPKPSSAGKWQTRFYNSARCLGIRVSVRAIDGSKVMVTRVEDHATKPGRPPVRRPDLRTEDLQRMYEGGLTLEQIAKRVSIARSSVAARLKKAGVQIRRRRR